MSMPNDESQVFNQERAHQFEQAIEEPENRLHVLAVGNQLRKKELCNYEQRLRSYAALCEGGR